MYNIFKHKTWHSIPANKGFTLFELLVAMGLIAVFSALVAANYSDFRQTSNLKGEAEKLTSLIRKAQIWALTGQTHGGERPLGGWGVYIAECTTPPCHFFLYADMSNPPNHTYEAIDDEIVTEVFTQRHVQITPLIPAGSAVDIVFTSPTSTGYINGTQIEDQAVITFFQTNTSQTQSITIDRKTNRIVLADVMNPPPPPQCSDGDDNDGDTFIDWPADPGCSSADDNDETDFVPPPSPEIVFEDQFSESSDTELSLHTPDVGTGWQGPPMDSVISNNHIPGATLKADAGSGALQDLSSCGNNSGSFYKTIDVFSTPDYLIQATFDNTGGTDDFGIIGARVQASGDMYLFQWDTNRGQLFLRYNGAWLQLGQDTAAVANGEEVRLKVYGNRISVSKFNGSVITLLINEVDNNLSAAGSAGVGLGAVVTYNADCDPQRLDDFIVTKNITQPQPQCNDGIDNDGDGLTDFGSDGDCSSASDDLEYASLPQVIPVFYDDFNADPSDAVLDASNYSTRVGPIIGSGWTQIVGGSSQQMRADSASDWLEDGSCGGNEASLYRIDDLLLSDDYEVSAIYRGTDSGNDYSILAARIQDVNNMYAFQWSTSRGELWVRNGGSWSQLGGDTSGLARADEVILKVEGSNISVLRNGAVIRSESDSTHTSAGYAGVGMGAVIESGADCSSQELDNFKVLIP